MHKFYKYLSAFGEIITSVPSIVFGIIDLMFFAFSLANVSFSFPPTAYIIILCAGLIISATNKIADKNESINKFKSDPPMLSLHLRMNQLRNNKLIKVFRLQNLWSKPIKDIKIEPILLGRAIFSFKLKLDGTNILKPDEERDLIPESQQPGILLFPAAFDPKYATANFTLNISFKDAQNNQYTNSFNIGKDDIFLKK